MFVPAGQNFVARFNFGATPTSPSATLFVNESSVGTIVTTSISGNFVTCSVSTSGLAVNDRIHLSCTATVNAASVTVISGTRYIVRQPTTDSSGNVVVQPTNSAGATLARTTDIPSTAANASAIWSNATRSLTTLTPTGTTGPWSQIETRTVVAGSTESTIDITGTTPIAVGNIVEWNNEFSIVATSVLDTPNTSITLYKPFSAAPSAGATISVRRYIREFADLQAILTASDAIQAKTDLIDTAAVASRADVEGIEVGGDSLTAQEVANAMLLAPVGSAATGSVQQRLTSLATASVTISGPVWVEDGRTFVALVAGDEYANGNQIAVTFAGYSGPNLAGKTVSLRIIDRNTYERTTQAEGEADLVLSTTASQTGQTVTASFTATSVQTSTLRVTATQSDPNYVGQFVATIDTDSAITLGMADVTVTRPVLA